MEKTEMQHSSLSVKRCINHLIMIAIFVNCSNQGPEQVNNRKLGNNPTEKQSSNAEPEEGGGEETSTNPPTVPGSVPPNDPPVQPAIPEPEEDLYLGIGMVWGNWLNLGFGDTAKKMDRLSMNTIASLGATATTANLAWIDIEKNEGQFDWSYADHQVAEALRRNLQIFAYIGLTPDWALDQSQIPNFHPGIGYRYPPADRYQGAFEHFFEAAARRYQGQIKFFKFWNEPNGCSWVNDGCSNGNYNSASLYVKWLKIAYQALKKGNPDAIVSIGGLDYNSQVTENENRGQIPFLRHIYAAGGKGFFDAVTLHPYGSPLNYQALRDNYSIMEENGDGELPIWIGEYGWASGSNGVSEESKYGYIREILATIQLDYPFVHAINYLVLTDLPNEDGADNQGYGLCSRYLDKLDAVIDEAHDNSVITCRNSAEALAEFSRVLLP